MGDKVKRTSYLHEPGPPLECASCNRGDRVWSLLLRLSTEGMLTLRAKPPSEAEFIDSLQKLKLAFNLLVRYRSPPPIGDTWPPSLSATAPPTGQTEEAHREPERLRAGAFPLWPPGDGEGDLLLGIMIMMDIQCSPEAARR